MLKKIPSLELLIDTLRHVPYLASKNVYRVATHFLSMDARQMEQFSAILKKAHKNVVQCSIYLYEFGGNAQGFSYNGS